jgi:hypothetical protein
MRECHTKGVVFTVTAEVLNPDLYPGAASELQQIVDSIRFE